MDAGRLLPVTGEDDIDALKTRIEHLTLAVEELTHGVCLYDDDGRIVVFNQAYEQITGVRPGAIRLGMTGRDVIGKMLEAGRHPGQAIDELDRDLHQRLLLGGGTDVHIAHDGRSFAARCHLAAGNQWMATFDEITQQVSQSRQSEEALRESEERFRLAAEAAGFGVWDYDVALETRQWSDRLREIFGFAPDIDTSLETALAALHPEDRDTLEQKLIEIREGKSAPRFEATTRIIRVCDGALRWISWNAWRTAKSASLAGRIILTVRDITDETMAQEKNAWSASHDALTGLANRGHFQTRLEGAIASAETDGAFALLMLDIDHFKQINDTLGHNAGDSVLRKFADRLKSITRAGDTLARLSGDEFAIIMRDTGSRYDVQALSNSILSRLREPFMYDGRALDCRASIGAALYPVHGRSASDLMKHVDLALYASKSGGRGISVLFDTRMKTDARRRGSMVRQARGALNDDRVSPYYQPKVNLMTGTIIGFEALMRWRSRHGKLRLPGAIAAAFTDHDVANAISDRMFAQVIGDMRGWLDRGVAFNHVAINASAAEFRRDDFGERILERLHRADIATRHLELEVTETVFLGRGAESVHRALELLDREGVRIALDDFGTGYASLRHLKQFPVHTIKIDCSFVRDMEEDAGDEAIVRAVINLGRSLAIKVVAEGIETEAQAERLARLNCALGQGFLFSKAVPASQVPAMAACTFDARSSPATDSRETLRLVG